MINNIKEYVNENFPNIRIVDYKTVLPVEKKSESNISITAGAETYHFTFEYKGKEFYQMFFDRPSDPISEQFKRALIENGITYEFGMIR